MQIIWWTERWLLFDGSVERLLSQPIANEAISGSRMEGSPKTRRLCGPRLRQHWQQCCHGFVQLADPLYPLYLSSHYSNGGVRTVSRTAVSEGSALVISNYIVNRFARRQRWIVLSLIAPPITQPLLHVIRKGSTNRAANGISACLI